MKRLIKKLNFKFKTTTFWVTPAFFIFLFFLGGVLTHDSIKFIFELVALNEFTNVGYPLRDGDVCATYIREVVGYDFGGGAPKSGFVCLIN